ncbi:NHLP-related RiPP peptide [Aquimonas voraii]|uniref:Putative modified peptide n=1 Tax=Aquimonas voraii TaxID=265719 RepID=A0A1G6X518_9GAMM|nr:NHLP-related RiPP peptide [Aquimonas voraii]SDD72467.1 putative modified peptide [Aquimonas voraii]
MDQYTAHNQTLDTANDAQLEAAPTRSLSQAQGQALLARLAQDDAFRAIYAADPATALLSIGVPAEVIGMLDRKCLRERQLADKAVFEALLRDMRSQTTSVAMAMHVPRLSFA